MLNLYGYIAQNVVNTRGCIKMSYKCPFCGKVPRPVWDKENKKVIWKNVFYIDWMMMVIIMCLLFSAWAYKHDTEKCREMMKDPYNFIKENNIQSNDFVMIEKEGETNESQLSPYIFNPKAS